MKEIKIKCPAKINLTLEVLNKRSDGYHNIKSVMQMINLYDYLDIKIEHAGGEKIILSGKSEEIPYDEKNLVYKAANLFLKKAEIQNVLINIYIEKNIPIAAGLAGGSTDAAGTIYGLNKLFNVFDNNKLNELCSALGSDLNVCLLGGCVLATSRGEVTEKLPNIESPVTLIKPQNLGISAKEAYQKYSQKEPKIQLHMTEKMISAIQKGACINNFLHNDLETAIFDEYKELQEIKKAYPNAIMSGSGSTYLVLENLEKFKLNSDYQFINNLNFINTGVEVTHKLELP